MTYNLRSEGYTVPHRGYSTVIIRSNGTTNQTIHRTLKHILRPTPSTQDSTLHHLRIIKGNLQLIELTWLKTSDGCEEIYEFREWAY